MKLEVELFDTKDRLPQVGETIVSIYDDGMFDRWQIGEVVESMYITEQDRKRNPDGSTSWRMAETQERINDDSEPYIILHNDSKIRSAKYFLINELKKHLTNSDS